MPVLSTRFGQPNLRSHVRQVRLHQAVLELRSGRSSDMAPGPAVSMNPYLAHLLSTVYDRSKLHPAHLADLRRSAITTDTIIRQKIRTVPPDMFGRLLDSRAATVEHAYIIPFADPAGGWMDHVKLRTFPDGAEVRGARLEERRERSYSYNGGRRKYLARRAAPPRVFFPLATMTAILHGPAELWVAEGPKKALSLAQLGLAAIGIESAWSWCVKGSRGALIPDFDLVRLSRRTVNLVPDPDAWSTPQIGHAMHRLAEALERRGARVQMAILPHEVLAHES
jgi:hypothetical protein